MNKPTPEEIEQKIKRCLEIGEKFQETDRPNPFITYLSHMTLAKQQNFNSLSEFYAANDFIQPNTLDIFKDENALPDDIEIKSLGGNYNPVYLVSMTRDGHTEKQVFKFNRQDKEEYLLARDMLAQDPEAQKTILGGSPVQVGVGIGEVYELWPFQEGADLTVKMKQRSPDQTKESIYNDCGNIIGQTMTQLGNLADKGVYMTDMKPDNIYFDADGNVVFADLKGMMNSAQVDSLQKLDRTPGYTPIEMYDSEGPIDLRVLSIYQMLITIEAFVNGKTLGQRMGDDLVLKAGEYYFATTPPEPYKPDFSNIDTSTPSGQALKMFVSHLESLKKGKNIDYHKIAEFQKNLKSIQENNPAYLKTLYEAMDKNLIKPGKIVEIADKVAKNPKKMMGLLNREMEKSRKSFFRKGKVFKAIRSLMRNLDVTPAENLYIKSQDEIALEGKFDALAKELQSFRDVENIIKGIGSNKLSGTRKEELMKKLDGHYEKIQSLRQELLDNISEASPKVSEHFQTVFEKTYGEGYFKFIEARYEGMSEPKTEEHTAKTDSLESSESKEESRESSVLKESEPKKSMDEQMTESHGKVKDLIKQFESIKEESVKAKANTEPELTDKSANEPKRPGKAANS